MSKRVGFEVVPILHGRRPSFANNAYRVCQRCRHEGKPDAKATHAIIWKRWFSIFDKTELICEDCRPDALEAALEKDKADAE